MTRFPDDWGRDRPTAFRYGSRARGTNPRAQGTNPRRMGTNPSAGTASDIARVGRLKRRALARLHARGERWCETCGDDGVVDVGDGTFGPCPDHRLMTVADADDILAGLM